MPPATLQIPIAKQTRFVMPIADDVRLVTLETARAVLGVTAESVKELYEDGHLPAFNLSPVADPARQMIRVWSGALRNSSVTNRDAIVADCLLTNVVGLQNEFFNLNNSQIERAWCVSNQMLLDLIKATPPFVIGVRVGRNWRVNRQSAAQFLKARML